jgi:hypothetical protein
MVMVVILKQGVASREYQSLVSFCDVFEVYAQKDACPTTIIRKTIFYTLDSHVLAIS